MKARAWARELDEHQVKDLSAPAILELLQVTTLRGPNASSLNAAPKDIFVLIFDRPLL